jgi:pyridinium-3,5-bisthiocarboxylic acid mononucleotide nickel chelatase
MPHQAGAAPRARRVLFLDPWGGVAGDMLLAALIDLREGDHLSQVLDQAVAAMRLPGVDVSVTEVREAGFRARRVAVTCSSEQPRRRPAELDSILARADLSDWVRAGARRAVARLVDVEAALHGVAREEVHLHELGAVDTLVDITGCLALLEALGEPTVIHGPVPLGAGTIETEHGRLSSPAPAALELLRGRPCYGGEERAERVTPTGALLLAEIARGTTSCPSMLPLAVGYGAGHRALSTVPNLLRAVLGEALEPVASGGVRPAASSSSSSEAGDEELLAGGVVGEGSPAEQVMAEEVVLLQATIDDSSGEHLAYLAERLLQAGALDVWHTPLVMKKGRPGIETTCLCRPADRDRLAAIVLGEGASLGVRIAFAGRQVVSRRIVEVDVRGRRVRVKMASGAAPATAAPEYEDAAAAARLLGIPLKTVYEEAAAQARRLLEG